MNIQVVYEDEDIVLVNKPAGVVVNRAESVKGETLQDWMDRRLEARTQNSKLKTQSVEDQDLFNERSGLVHRLDKETSGVLMLAKHPEALVQAMRMFKERRVQKTYVALVHGRVSPESGDVNLPIQRSSLNRHKFEVGLGGKSAVSNYQVVKYLQMPGKLASKYQDGFSLVEVKPVTGRTHQIRVHMTHIRHPLVSDELYGGRKRVRLDKEWCGRHFLHARRLEFEHPVTGEVMKVEAELSSDLQAALEQLDDAE